MDRDRGRDIRQDRPWERDRPAGPQRAPAWSGPPVEFLTEGEELVAGRRPVEEAFVARRAAHRLLVVPSRRQALERLVLHATSLRIPVVEVEGGTLTAIAGFDGHQGIALVVEPRRFAGLDDILARAVERGEAPFVLVMDSLEDPQNVGTLLRSAEAAGVHGVIFPTHRQAPLTPAAVKASAGAVEHLLLCPVDDLPGALSDLRIRGLRIAAAEADAPLTADEADLRGPIAIIVGSEGQGLAPAVRRRADLAVRIPMRGNVGSLNAAVAGSILLFAAVTQRPAGAAEAAPVHPVRRDLAIGPVDADAVSGTESDAEPVGSVAPAPASRRQPRAAKAPKAAKAADATTPTKSTPAKATKATKATTPATAAKRAKATKPTKAVENASPAKTPRTTRARKPADAAEATTSTEAGTTERAGSPTKSARATKRATTSKTAAPDAVTETVSTADDLLPGASSASPVTPRKARAKRSPKA